jgi:hypothetical protein
MVHCFYSNLVQHHDEPKKANYVPGRLAVGFPLVDDAHGGGQDTGPTLQVKLGGYVQETETGRWPTKRKVIPLVQKGAGARGLNDAERNLLQTAGLATADCCHCCHHCCCYCWESNHCAGLHTEHISYDDSA